MPGKCKFSDSWLCIDLYKNWLLKVPTDLHLARCSICKKNIKLDSMGESAFNSHAKCGGHPKAMKSQANGK